MNKEKRIRQNKFPNFLKRSFVTIWRKILIYKKILITWLIIIILLEIGLHFNIDKKAMFIGLSIFAIITKAFTGLLVLIGLIPFIGPPLVNILSLPFFWLLNALGYFISIIAIKKGHTNVVISYRLLTIVFLTGIAIGFIISRLFH